MKNIHFNMSDDTPKISDKLVILNFLLFLFTINITIDFFGVEEAFGITLLLAIFALVRYIHLTKPIFILLDAGALCAITIIIEFAYIFNRDFDALMYNAAVLFLGVAVLIINAKSKSAILSSQNSIFR